MAKIEILIKLQLHGRWNTGSLKWTVDEDDEQNVVYA